MTENQANDGAYVVETRGTPGKDFGLVILSVIAAGVLFALYFFGHVYSIYGTIGCLILLTISVTRLLTVARVRWRFDAGGIERRTHGVLGSRTRRIALTDIIAVGVETTHPSRLAKPFQILSSFANATHIFDLERERAEKVELPPVYRLAFRLQSGETLMVDEEQTRDAFAERLQHLSQRLPGVTWPVLG